MFSHWEHTPQFAEAHRLLKPNPVVNQNMEKILHILEDRKENNLSASNQKHIVSQKACPLYLLG